MKPQVIVLSLVLSLGGLTAGCQTTAFSPEHGAAALRIATSTGATLALNKNPGYVEAVRGLALGIDSAVSDTVTLEPVTIARFVRDLCEKNGVAPADIPVFVNLANSVYQAYVTAYRPAIVSTADPKVLLYVRAFKSGLTDALAAVQ